MGSEKGTQRRRFTLAAFLLPKITLSLRMKNVTVRTIDKRTGAGAPKGSLV